MSTDRSPHGPPPGWYRSVDASAAGDTELLWWWDGTGWTSAAQRMDDGWIEAEPMTPPPSLRRARSASWPIVGWVAVGLAVAALALIVVGVGAALVFRDQIDDGFDELTMGADDFIERSCSRDLAELQSAADRYQEQNGEIPSERELVISSFLEKESPYYDLTATGQVVTEDDSPCDEP